VFPNLSVLENLELGSFTRARERRAANLERVFGDLPAPEGTHRRSWPAR
jgi:branched-chain amino acid transport system ATP-binding protein